ncbi:MAG: outer membrane lipoprotein carrier protein LolA [Bacteroidota bacterium]
MKKVAFVLTLFLTFGQLAMAQYDPQAKDILDRVNQKYSSMKAFKADFVNKLQFDFGEEQGQEGIDEEFTGTVYIKDDLFKLEVGTRTIFFDGKLIREYDGDTQEYTIREPEASDLEEFNISSVLNLYKEGFKYRVREQDKSSYSIELVPVKNDKSYNKLVMKISTGFDIQSITYFEKDGNLVTILVEELQEQPNLSNSFFSLYQAKLEVIDSIDLR